MQFIPTFSSQASAWSLFDSAGFTAVDYNSDSDFNDLMQEALEDVEEKEERSVSQAMQSNPLLTGPYNPRVSADGVTFTLDEVSFTKSELAELRSQLLKEGAPAESLTDFDILAGQPDGATLAQVLASLQMNSRKPSLSDDDEKSLTALLNQLDPSGQLTDETLDLMRNGHAQQALAGISSALMELDATSRISLSQDDLALLGKALNLPDSVLGKMRSMFGSATDLELSKEQMQVLLSPATDHLAQLASRQQKLDAAAEATVKNVINKARERMKKEQQAESLQSREVEQSKTMIKETVQEDSHGTLTDALRQSGDEQLNKALSKNAQGSDLPDGFEHLAKQGQADPQQHLAGGNQDGKGRNTPDGGKNNSNTWSSLLSKVDLAAGNATNVRSDGVMGTAFANLYQLSGQQQPAGARAEVGPYLSAQAAQQVQNGLLSALRNGGTRLDLQLNPVELGSIAITLSSRNGEVSAHIRAEKTETMQAMQQQVEAIRLQLEQQGVKIDKIEVQLQNQNNDQQQLADTWQNMQQHNSWAEQDARREELARLRNLAMARRGAENQGNNGLAQSMQDTEQTAIYATRRLNVVA